MSEITCANHTLFVYDGRHVTCMSCGLAPRPEPPKPPEVEAEVVAESESAPTSAEPETEAETRGVGVKTPRGAKRVKAGKG